MAASSRRRGRRAVNVGGSMSGLCTAAFLRRTMPDCSSWNMAGDARHALSFCISASDISKLA
ncbi:MAG: hypothetical protein QOD25_2354 [Alphaproteobacteria bacterium]|nr:hypothetical protein [Alphaproteobacteria bacterium]